MAQPGHYDRVSVGLHWTLAVLAGVLVVVGFRLAAAPFPSLAYDRIHLWHRSLGEIVFVAALMALWWRARRPKVAPFDETPWRRRAATAVHVALLALLVVIPAIKLARGTCALGWRFFAWHIDAPFGACPSVSRPLGLAHKYSAYTLIILVAVHVTAALWRTLVRREAVIKRMLPNA